MCDPIIQGPSWCPVIAWLILCGLSLAVWMTLDWIHERARKIRQPTKSKGEGNE